MHIFWRCFKSGKTASPIILTKPVPVNYKKHNFTHSYHALGAYTIKRPAARFHDNVKPYTP